MLKAEWLWGMMAVPALRHIVLTTFGLVAVLTATEVCAQGPQGENYSAGKTPAQLFNSDCTGAGCHRGPQGLAKGRSSGSLSGFLREHYTNSRESAAALADYLQGVPGTSDSRAARPGPASGSPSRPATVRRDDNAKPSNEPGASTPAPPRQTLRHPPKTDDAAKPTEAPAANVPPKPAATRPPPRQPATAAAPVSTSPPVPPLVVPRVEIFD
jgi:hypothetical protein